MAPKKGAAKPKKVVVGASRDKEWVPSKTLAADLNRMVAAGVLLDHLTTGWWPASGEPFPTPHTDEAVVFEDYFWRGLGFPVHPFLRDLMEFWAITSVICTPTPYCTCQSLSIYARRFLVFFHTSTSSGTYSV